MKGFLAVLIAFALLPFCGCVQYTKTMTPDELSEWGRKKSETGGIATIDLEVLAKDGAVFKLGGARVDLHDISGDGIKTYPDGRAETFMGAIRFEDISLVKTRRPDALGSLLAYGAVGVLIAAVTEVNEGGEGVNVDIRYPSSGGSCPLVFAWDGNRYRFESETFAGAYGEALEFSQKECMSHLVPDGGRLRLALANNAPESHHTNRIAVLALDHPSGTEIGLGADGQPYSLRSAESPLRARSYDSTDVLALISRLEDGAWESDLERTEQLRDGLVCEFAIPAGATHAKLRVSAHNTGMGEYALHKLLSLRGPGRMMWCYEMSSESSEVARFKAWQRREGGMEITVAQGSQWILQGWLPDVGARVHTERVVPIDLRDLEAGVLKVRLDGTAGLWFIDRVAIDFSIDEPVYETQAVLQRAESADGVDVTRRLADADSLYYAALPGDHAVLTFEDPPRLHGGERTYVLVSQGYYHPWVEEGPIDFGPLLKRILEEPQLGQRLYLPEWKQVKSRYAQLQVEPTFPFKADSLN